MMPSTGDNEMLYFAYGFNMNWEQMRNRCPSATFLCIAKFPTHKLGFSRELINRRCCVADAVLTEGDEVCGVIYQIRETEICRLNESGGYDPGRPKEENAYFREERLVFRDGDKNDPLLVHTYFANSQENAPLPNAKYKNLILEAAKFWHLLVAYIAKLEMIEVGNYVL